VAHSDCERWSWIVERLKEKAEGPRDYKRELIQVDVEGVTGWHWQWGRTMVGMSEWVSICCGSV
jgi:hypothetical protein